MLSWVLGLTTGKTFSNQQSHPKSEINLQSFIGGMQLLNIMWRTLVLVMVFSIMSLNPADAQEETWTGNINVFLGAKALDEEDWAPAENQGEFGIQVDFRPRNWVVNLAVDYLVGSGDGNLLGVEFESETSELNIGVRKIWEEFPHVRPFIGGGLSFIRGEFSGFGVSDSDSGTGIWFGGGVYWTLVEHFNIGLDLKYSTAEVTLFGVDANAGGGHFGLLAGYHW